MVDVDEWNNHHSKCNDLTKFCTKQRKNLQDPVVVQGADRPHLPHESIFPLEAWLTPRHSDTTAMHKSDPERMNNPTGVCATLSFLKPKRSHRKAATRKSLFLLTVVAPNCTGVTSLAGTPEGHCGHTARGRH